MPKKITKTFWVCDVGHEHSEERAAVRCERSRRPSHEKEAEHRRKQAEATARQSARDAEMIEKRRANGKIVADGPYAGLTNRSAQCLKAHNLTPEQAGAMTDAQLLRNQGTGWGAVKEIRAWLKEHAGT